MGSSSAAKSPRAPRAEALSALDSVGQPVVVPRPGRRFAPQRPRTAIAHSGALGGSGTGSTHLLLIILGLAGALLLPLPALAQDDLATGAGHVEAAAVHSAEESSGVSPYAYQLFQIGPFPVTNAMVTSWVVSIFLIVLVRGLIGRKPTLIPGKGQAVVESLVQTLRDIFEPIVGKGMIRVTFPLLAAYFIFILIQNWSGLIPGVGVFGTYGADGHLDYWFRPGNADLNMTLALALVSFVAWLYFVLRYAGPGTLFYDLFGNKADKREVPFPLYLFLFFIFFAVGIIEVISILFRPVSLSFRLFGNVYGGENLLTSMTDMAGWIVPVPFYFLELLIGFVQALVFALLVSVYIGLVCNHEGGDHGSGHSHGEKAEA